MTAPKLPAEPTLMTEMEIETCIRHTLTGMFPPDYHGPINRLCNQAIDAIALRSQLTSALARVAEMEANDGRYRARRSHDWYEYDDYVTAVAPPSTDDCSVTRSSEDQFMEGYDQDSDMMAEDYLDDAAIDAMDPKQVKS